MKRERTRTNKPHWLYSVYRNADDRLMAFDLTAEQCAKVLGIRRKTFLAMMCPSCRNQTYTIYKIRPDDARRQAEEVDDDESIGDVPRGAAG